MALIISYSESIDACTLHPPPLHHVSPPESVDADTPPPSCIPTTHLARATVLRCGRVLFGVARAAASPPTIRQTRHPRNRTFETMAIMLIRVGMCSNNRSLGIHYLVCYNHK